MGAIAIRRPRRWGRRLGAAALGASLAVAGLTALPAHADTPWLVIDENNFAHFRIPVSEVEAAVGQDVSQIVAEGNFGPSANWAEFGLSIQGDLATGILGPLSPGHYYYQVTADDHLTVKDPTNPTSVASEPEWSTFFIDGEGAEHMADAPEEHRGEVSELTYRSSVAGEDRTALVWTRRATTPTATSPTRCCTCSTVAASPTATGSRSAAPRRSWTTCSRRAASRRWSS